MSTSRYRPRFRRAATAALLAALLLTPPMLDAPASAAASTTRVTARSMNASQQRVVNDINYSRRAKGKRSLRTNGLMNQRAQNWARHLVSCQCLQHRSGPYGAPSGWCAAAENVGRSGNGGRLGALHAAFMRSSGHRQNILNSRWTTLGVGVARDGSGEYFVVHAFADFSC
jgi:uncharacterized protein YkwD